MYRKLFESLREYITPSIKAPVYVLCEVVMECVIPFVVAKLVNNIRDGSSFENLLLYGVILIIMAFLSLLFGILAGNACSTASCGFAKNLRSDMFRAIQNFSFENIDKFSTASLVTRLTTDVNDVQESYMMIVRTAIRGPLMLIFSFVMALIMGGKIALIFLFVIPVMCLGLYAIARKAMPIFKILFERYDNFNNSIQENISAIRLVKAFVREDYEKQKFSQSSGALCADFTLVEKIIALNNPLAQFSLYTVTIFVLYYGTYKIITSHNLDLNVGQISSLLTYTMQILGSLMRLSMVLVMITMARESVVRIVEVLNEKPVITNPPNPSRNIQNGSVEFENVSFSYEHNSKFALQDVNLRIESGETIGILGGTGSAKTTLVQLIPRLYDPDKGCVRVSGVDVRNYDLKTLRDSVAVVLQKNELFSGTVRENLRFGNDNATEDDFSRACEIACADEFIQNLPQKYDTRIEQNGRNLSGGQKQRLCLARALLKNPKILILDDSTSAVDTQTDSKIRSGLRNSLPDATKIIIAQRILSVKDADRIIIMEGGKIQGIGTHEELLKNNRIYGEIYSSQNREESE